MDYFRLIALEMAKGEAWPEEVRARLYDRLRHELATSGATGADRAKSLVALEKAIRRHEVQALLEDSARSR